jgi:hypothetical protein
MAAVLLGAGVGIAGTNVHAGLLAAAPETSPPVASSAAGHVDARFDQLEKRLNTLENLIDLNFNAARNQVDAVCGRR